MSMSDNSSDPLVHRELRGAVALLSLNRPAQYNALSKEMIADLHENLDLLAADPSVRAVVLGGAGKAFCAGHDLKQLMANRKLEYYERLFDDCSRLMIRIQTLPQPVIARVHGIATAAGCQLVAACDLAVASSEARFAVSGINLGLFCATPSVPLSRNVGRKAAFEMLVTGEFIDAATAMQHGLINRYVDPEQLDGEIAEMTAAIIAKPRSVVAAGKSLFFRQLEMGVTAAYQVAGQSMACNMLDNFAQEGVLAFIEKRPPNWPVDSAS